MKTKVFNFANWLLTAVISLLGFSACSNSDNGMLCMYGTPTFDYQAEGCVTDEEGNPIEGIQLKVTLQKTSQDSSDSEIIFSDKDGEFTTPKYYDRMIFSLTAEDIDGAKNGGEFESKQIDLTKMKLELDKTNADGWYEGVNIYKDIEIVMSKKTADEE